MNSDWSLCQICDENVDVGELTQLCNCNHIFCSGCLREYFTNYLAQSYHELQEAKLPFKMDVLCRLRCPAQDCSKQIDHNQLVCTLLRRPAEKKNPIGREKSTPNDGIGRLSVLAYGSDDDQARIVRCSWTETLDELRRRVCEVLGSSWIPNTSALHVRCEHVEYQFLGEDGERSQTAAELNQTMLSPWPRQKEKGNGWLHGQIPIETNAKRTLVETNRTFQYVDLKVEENGRQEIKHSGIERGKWLVFDRCGELTGKKGVLHLVGCVCEERTFRSHRSLPLAENASLAELLTQVQCCFGLDYYRLEQMALYLMIPPLDRQLDGNTSLDSLHNNGYQFALLDNALLNRSLKEVGIQAEDTVVVDLSGDIQLLLLQSSRDP